MDNLTHSLTGALLGAALAPEADPRSVPVRSRIVLAIVATNAPDLDLLVAPFVDPQALLTLHRGVTHSFVMAPVWALLGIGTLLAWRWRSVAVASATLLVLGAYVAACTLLMLSATGQAEARARALGPKHQAFALPQPWSPLRWKLVVLSRNNIHTAYADLLPGAAPAEWRQRHRFGDDPLLRAFGRKAWDRPELEDFRRFALMPRLYAIEQPNPNLLCAWFTDLRFESPQRAGPFHFGVCHGIVAGATAVDPERGWALAVGPAPAPPE